MRIKVIRFALSVMCMFVLNCTNAVASDGTAMQGFYKFDGKAIFEYAKKQHEEKMKQPQFKAVCDTGGGSCVDDVFNWTNVQMIQAVGLAEIYAKTKNNHDIICSPKYRNSYNDDYVQCVDKAGKNFYEFKFDDVKESMDETIRKDVMTAVCELLGGKVRDDSVRFCDKANCGAVNQSLRRFGYEAEYKNILNQSSNSGCRMYANSVDSSKYELRNGNGDFSVDSKKFMALQLQSSIDMEFLIKRYVARQMKKSGLELQELNCNKGFQTYFNDSIDNHKDDMLTCHAKATNGKEYDLDFLFDDANELWDQEAKAGTSGLNCIADQGGVYDGKNCSGLSQEQCAALDSQLPGGTKWDYTLDTCVLKDAAKAQSIKDTARTVSKVAIGVTVIALTGGSGAALVVSVAATSAATAGAAMSSAVQAKVEDEVRAAIAKSAKCNEATCAEVALKTLITDAVPFYEKLTEDTQVFKTLDDELARLFKILPGNADVFQDMISQTIKETQNIRDWDKWPNENKLLFAADALLLVGAAAGIGQSFANGWKSIVKLFKGAGNATATTTRLVEKLDDVFGHLKKTVDTTAEVVGVVDDGVDIIDTSSKIGVAFAGAV